MFSKGVVIAIVAVVVIAAAASAYYFLAPPEVSAEQIKSWALTSAEEVNTYKFEMSMEASITGTGQAGTQSYTIQAWSTGEVDVENKKMKMEFTMQTPPMGAAKEEEVSMELYIVEDYVYTYVDGQWFKTELPEDAWGQKSPLEGQVSLLEASNVKRLPDEAVDGVDCYVLEIQPDLEKLWEVLSSQPGMEEAPSIPIEQLKQVVKGFTVKEWIDKQTHLPRKVLMSMNMEFDLGMLGSMSIDMDFSMKFFGYNEPVTIELPPEAIEAVEVPSPPSGLP